MHSKKSLTPGTNKTLPDAPGQEQLNPVKQNKEKLDNLIEDLNTKLVQHFKAKQQALLNQYKQELIEQQKKLNELKNTTNQQQIRNKMLERKAELEKQRSHLIQTNMYFSQKCEQYKQVYTKLVQESRDLEKEIQFLDSQIEIATSKRLRLADELGSATERLPAREPVTNVKNTPLPEIDRDADKNEPSTMPRSYGATQSVRKIARSLHVAPAEDRAKKSSSHKYLQKIDRNLFKKSTMERIFEECVEEIKSKRKNKRAMPSLKGQEFTEYEKRAVMELFLGNEDVKKKLYQVIFAEGDKNFKRPMISHPKTKISFDQMQI